MSLKALHVCFIILSILLALGFGVWTARDFTSTKNLMNLGMGIASFLGVIALLGYLFWFLSKMKRVGDS